MSRPSIRLLISLVLSAAVLAALAAPAAAQATGDDEGVLVRVNGDVTVPEGEDHGVIVVVDGDLELRGSATTVVVVNGTADIAETTVETLVVVSGIADLGPGTLITGDVRLVDTSLIRAADVTIEGDLTRGAGSEVFSGFWVVGFIFMIGWTILVILSALLLAAVAPDLARRAGRTITDDLGPTIIAGLVLWIPVPIVAALIFATLIGIPTALAIWLFALPVLGFAGFLVAGVRLGEYLTSGGGGVGHPYLAALVGVVLLIVIGAVPLLGPLVVTVAGFLGSGALALRAFRSARSGRLPAAPTAPASPASATPGL